MDRRESGQTQRAILSPWAESRHRFDELGSFTIALFPHWKLCSRS